MVHELRIYRCLPGRLPALNDRFRNITLKLWDKHGIKQAGFWTVLIGENQHELYYLLEWASLAEREQKWNAFASDPQWLSSKAETEKDQQIVASINNMILTPTDYSAIK
ncbi:MAG: NIPSNAP family protein [Burkholderiaceae bacterium]